MIKMTKRRVLIKKEKKGNTQVYSYVSLEEDKTTLMTKICLKFDIEDIKNEIEELKPFIRKSNQLKRELIDCENLLRLINEEEFENAKKASEVKEND